MRMSPRERMLVAMTGGTPDRVPCSPDTNWMIPAKHTGRPFWDVFRGGDPPIWKAYNDYVKATGLDGFSHHGTYHVPRRAGCEETSEVLERSDERVVVRSVFRCPAGEVDRRTVFLRDDAPAPVRKPITDFAGQIDVLRYMMFGDVEEIDFTPYRRAREDMGEHGVVGLCMLLPHLIVQLREPAEASIFDYYDHHDLLATFMREWEEYLLAIADRIIEDELAPDFVFFPNSGAITMQSPDICREFTLPALKSLTAKFKRAGIVTSLHSCGKERALVEMAADETDLDCIDPLEAPPMGDCDLREVKGRFGARLALKGNLHTTEVMLRMSPEGVARAAREVLELGMPGGGFVLSTGDQCGRDTPQANIAALVDVCERYGAY